jgi:four helix bundle protein
MSLMERQQVYHDLKVWQYAIKLVPDIYKLVGKLPKEESYTLSDQIRRPAVSIPASIAEGQARQHVKKFLQHLWIAKDSLAELDTLLILAEKLSYLKPSEVEPVSRKLRDLRVTLQDLINRLQRATEN